MSTSERPATLCEAFQRTAAIDPDAVALRTPGGTQTLTWREYADQVRRSRPDWPALGVRRGDTVSLMMANRVEFYPLEVGAQHVGAISFSVYNTLPAEQLVYLFDNADTKVVICEAQYVDRIRASGADIEHIVCLDGSPEGTLSVDDLVAAGADDFDFESAWRAVQADDVATLIYTSGTTGNPKGVEMTHANLLFQAFAVDEVLGVRFGDRITSFLPTAHIADRMGALYLQEVFGTQITTVSDPRRHRGSAARRASDDLGRGAAGMGKAQGGNRIRGGQRARRDEAAWGCSGGWRWRRRRPTRWSPASPVADDVAAEWAQADELVLSKLREKLGLEQVRHAVSGAAPIPKETLAFFIGSGHSDLRGVGHVGAELHRDGQSIRAEARLGTVGKLVPGHGGQDRRGRRVPGARPAGDEGLPQGAEEDRGGVDEDGWLHTGDIIEADEDGYLRIVDRKKELIINAAGKNMSPANIENTIKAACPLIGVVLVIGDARPYNTALIVLDAESAAPYAAQRGLADSSPGALAAHPDVIAEIAAGVAERQRQVVEGGADQALPGVAHLLGAGRRRDHADDEAQAQADPREVRRRDRRALRRRHRRRGVHEPKAAASAAQ